MDVSLLGEGDQRVARGEIGEIVVRSRYLAAGYWREPALTAERFSGTLGGVRQFRTGDMARINAKGQLEFAGRRDARIKIRGYRIELSEIEGALQRLPGIKETVVDAIGRGNKEPVLVGYIVTGAGHHWSPARLRTELRSLLPDYLVPSIFLLLGSFPLTSSGRSTARSFATLIDPWNGVNPRRRRRPPNCCWASYGLTLSICPKSVARIISSNLGVTSLIATVVAARLHTMLGVEIGLEIFADYPTLAAFAQVVEDAIKVPAAAFMPEITSASRAAPLPLSLFQEHWWLAAQTQKESAGQALAHSFRILGALDIQVLRDCMTYLARHHEVLRTTFAMVDGVPVQVIHPPVEVHAIRSE